MPFTIDIADEQTIHAINHARLKAAVQDVFAADGLQSAEVSIAIVNDRRMHELNLKYLQHDYPTDVLSFVLDRDEQAATLDGEIIVSAEYAAREAVRFGWTTDDELLFYVIHGCLHLVGYDDQSPEDRAAMREAELHYLSSFGLKHRYEEPQS